MKRINIIVSGLVQGVGFRAFIKHNADMKGLSGFTRNLPDGTVEIEVEGISEEIDKILSCIKGKNDTYIRVDSLTITNIPVTGQKGFSIRR
jgi:acylphosphatase